MRLLLALLALTPRPMALALGSFAMRWLDRLSPRLRGVALRNLELAMPELPLEQRAAIVTEVFQSLARMLVVEARLPRLNRANIGEWIRYEGLEHFTAAKQQGRGVLFYTAHLGNWELSALAHGMLTEPMHVVVRPLDNPLIERYASRLRSLSGNRIISKKDARPVLRALAANEAVGILADQNAAPEEGEFVPFFGIEACAHTGIARIAARAGTPVIPGFALWSDTEQRYILRFYPALEMTGDARRDTARLHAQLEEVIRCYPGQWLWIHRRWKTRPPGEPSLY